MNQEVAKKFPDCSVEAIKGMRRKADYHKIVTDILAANLNDQLLSRPDIPLLTPLESTLK